MLRQVQSPRGVRTLHIPEHLGMVEFWLHSECAKKVHTFI
jgi:hypothetical protein